MSKIAKILITFIVSFVIAYLIVGYVNNGMFVRIHWVEDITIWRKMRWYYIINYPINVIPSLVIAGITTVILSYRLKLYKH